MRFGWGWWDNGWVMAQITIRNVPEAVRDELKARAARKRQSMQAFLLGELERIVSKPSMEELMERVRKRLAKSNTHVTAEEILRHRDAGRK